MRRATSQDVQGQQLKVQELPIRTADTNLYTNSGSDTIVKIGESVEAVVSCVQLDNSVPDCVLIPAASLSVVDSTAFTAGGDRMAIKIAGVQLAANDLFLVKYISTN